MQCQNTPTKETQGIHKGCDPLATLNECITNVRDHAEKIVINNENKAKRQAWLLLAQVIHVNGFIATPGFAESKPKGQEREKKAANCEREAIN